MAEKIIPYIRDREANKDAPYATKFAPFIKIINHAKATGCTSIVIVEPWVIGIPTLKSLKVCRICREQASVYKLSARRTHLGIIKLTKFFYEKFPVEIKK